MYKFFAFFLYLVFVFDSPSVFCQVNAGTEFWMGFMDHLDNKPNDSIATLPTQILYITSDQDVDSVYIETSNASWDTLVNIIADSITLIPIPTLLAITPHHVSDTNTPTALHITASENIVVYAHQYHQFRSDASLILPIDAIGTNYRITTYNTYTFPEEIVHPAEFIIVATKDSTAINIIPKANTTSGKPANIAYEVILNKGGVYQVQSHSDLTGSSVIGHDITKPFAVYSGNTWTGIPDGCAARDNLYEQMFPVETWGKEYISMLPESMPGGRLRILNAEPNTKFKINGSGFYTIPGNNSFLEFIADKTQHIIADKPIYVVQYLPSQSCTWAQGISFVNGDPAMFVLNPVLQFINNATFYSSPYELIEDNYIMIATLTKDTGFIYLDSIKIGSSFSIVPNTAKKYSYIVMNINAGTHNLTTSGGCGFNLYVYGKAYAESYAYAGGAGLKKNGVISLNPEKICAGEPFTFLSETYNDSIHSWQWDFGDGSTSTETNPTHTYIQAGNYNVELSVITSTGCFTDSFTKKITMSVGNIDSIFVNQNDTICTGESVFHIDSISVENDSVEKYYWDFGDNNLLEGDSVYFSYPEKGTAIVNLYTYTMNGCADTTSIDLYIKASPDLDLSDITICGENQVNIGIEKEEAYTYSWMPSTGLDDFTFSNPVLSLSSISDSIYVFELNISDNESGCSASDTIFIKSYFLSPQVNILNDTTIEAGSCLTINITSPGQPPYHWVLPDGQKINGVDQIYVCPDSSQIYQLIDNKGCIKFIEVNTLGNVSIILPMAFSPNGDGVNDLLFPQQTGITDLLYFDIYNRWGEEVFHTSNILTGWDGTYSNIPQEAGVYIYMISGKGITDEIIKYQGIILLIR